MTRIAVSSVLSGVLFVVLFGSLPSTAQPDSSDNLYCKAGNIPLFGEKDGPATLPKACFYTAVSATPSPGREIKVPADADLKNAIGSARCGDTLVLAAGAQFEGGFEFPAKGCDDGHWITVRSSGQLPPEGTRISPCYAGVASLPDRPHYPCNSPQNAMARLMVPAKESIDIADHYRFIGLEITRPVHSGMVSALVRAREGTKIVFDRVWMHGTPTDETQRAIGIPGATYVAVIDSYFSDFHCVARTGSCVDSQVLWAGTGTVPGGSYKVVNNFLEAAAEPVLFGGGPGSATPADIEIRRNYFYKPQMWNPSHPTFFGTSFVVKNNFELKNAERVLFEGNVLENTWGGFSQSGFQILLTPKSQNSQCPLCVVRDITIRRSILRHSGSGVQISAGASDSGGFAQGLENVSIHDVLIDDIDAERFKGSGIVFQISRNQPFYRNLTIDHVTVTRADRDLFVVGSRISDLTMENIVITNNIFDTGRWGVTSSGGRSNCAFHRRGPEEIFESCWKPRTVTNNVLIGGNRGWPKGNFGVDKIKDVGFTRVGEEDPDYRLLPQSRFYRKGSDRKDIGADFAAIAEATRQVVQ